MHYVNGAGIPLHGNDMTARATHEIVLPRTVATGESLIDCPINSPGTPNAISSPNITSDLECFLGTGKTTTTIDPTDISSSLTINNSQSESVNSSSSVSHLLSQQ